MNLSLNTDFNNTISRWLTVHIYTRLLSHRMHACIPASYANENAMSWDLM